MGNGKSAIEDTTQFQLCICNKTNPEFELFKTEFVLTNNMHDYDYVFTHKLKKIIPLLNKLITQYLSSDLSTADDIMLELTRSNTGNIYSFNTIKTRWYRAFLFDMLQIISRVCKKHQRSLVVRETIIYETFSGSPQFFYDFKSLKRTIISETDYQNLLNILDYTKVIPFNMSRCLQKKIKLPLVVKILIEKFGHDLAGEIAAYLYVICIR